MESTSIDIMDPQLLQLTDQVKYPELHMQYCQWSSFWSEATFRVAVCLCIVHVHKNHGLMHHLSRKNVNLGLPGQKES